MTQIPWLVNKRFGRNHSTTCFCAGIQLRALQAARPYLPGEGEHWATAGATWGCAGPARSHAHVTLHRPAPRRGRLLGREAQGGGRGVGTMAGGTGPVAVSGGSVQQQCHSQGTLLHASNNDLGAYLGAGGVLGPVFSCIILWARVFGVSVLGNVKCNCNPIYNLTLILTLTPTFPWP